MKRSRRTKILATLGPASESPEMIARLFEAGADVFRLNMSHLPRERLKERVGVIRGLEARYRRPIAILADLQGPKLRVGAFGGDGAMLVKGESFTFDGDKALGDAQRVHLPHPEVMGALVDETTLERARNLGLDPADHLARNDSTSFFDRLGDLLVTGPTRTNVNDCRIILVG